MDKLMNEIINTVKIHEKAVPKSRFKKNIKSYWCFELDTLKRIKVQAFRAWDNAGRSGNNTGLYFKLTKWLKRTSGKDLN